MNVWIRRLTQTASAGLLTVLALSTSLADIPVDRPDPQPPLVDPAIAGGGDEFSMWMQILAGLFVVAGVFAAIMIVRRRKA